ncbi:hypothetical protein [Devosia sp. MC521]|uniref:hypothetical protein n=1 Tax=Devosia sp. MC521 TaxID=2759954 RepID=UPI0015FC464F|nr:hypothetical protein [Devosia sp. MC521]MBJ6986040.1 hypothetical protein [Devosia sp. MC521]QMW61411.1 hypothetical protein H4N61_10490 [Devosia sp. MC521]
MDKIQEIEFKLDNKTVVLCHLIERGYVFDVDIIYPPHGQWVTKTLHEKAIKLVADRAFEAAVADVLSYTAANGHALIEIDNPCNTEFLQKQDQIAVLQTLGQSLPVKVNGL